MSIVSEKVTNSVDEAGLVGARAFSFTLPETFKEAKKIPEEDILEFRRKLGVSFYLTDAFKVFFTRMMSLVCFMRVLNDLLMSFSKM